MNTHPINTQYKGSTLSVQLEFEDVLVDDLDNILFRLVPFDKPENPLFKGCMVAKTGYVVSITKLSAKVVEVVIPASVTEDATSDVYDFYYELQCESKAIYKSRIEKVLKFETLEV
jgi:hypothetical protein